MGNLSRHKTPSSRSRRARALLVLAGASCLLMVASFGLARPPQALAQATPPGPPPAPAKPRLLVIGDSVLEGTFDKIPAALPEWDVTLDAHLNRNTEQALGVIEAHGTTFDAVVVQLGTNDAASPAVYRPRANAVMDALAPVPRVLWLTIHEVRPYYFEANQITRELAAAHANVQVVDWNLAEKPGDSYDDGLHLTPQGAVSMAAVIAEALRGPASPAATTTTTTSTTTTTTSLPDATSTTAPASAGARPSASTPPGATGRSSPHRGPSWSLALVLIGVVVALAAVPLVVVRQRRARGAASRLVDGETSTQ